VRKLQVCAFLVLLLVTIPANAQSFSVLYNFGSKSGDPANPSFSGIVVQGRDGNLYSTTDPGGANGAGAVFKITPSGMLTLLYSFTGGSDGANPSSGLTLGTDGNFYGSTLGGGSNFDGTIFKITPSGILTVLHNFNCTDGCEPVAGLVQGTDGAFYGTTFAADGTVFKITAAGALTTIHTFSGADGAAPFGGLVQATDGNFYGTASSGGTLNDGTIFRLSPKGSFSVLYNFDGTSGSTPYVTPIQDTNGIIYGDTDLGGTGSVSPCTAGNCGVFYRLNASLKAFVSLRPYSGKVGNFIELFGQGFSSTSTVSFNGIAATPTVTSSTYLTAAVPNGATTGFVKVTTSGGTLTSNKKFRVTPQITSFTPTNGLVGALVTITGISLTQATAVTFGGVRATTFTVNSDTQVTVKVPSGAKTGKISVTTPGGKATSATSFTVT
jgi:uncharacterized repeat protein (TIGR03803 family)